MGTHNFFLSQQKDLVRILSPIVMQFSTGQNLKVGSDNWNQAISFDKTRCNLELKFLEAEFKKY